jgi:hypothetical protein
MQAGSMNTAAGTAAALWVLGEGQSSVGVCLAKCTASIFAAHQMPNSQTSPACRALAAAVTEHLAPLVPADGLWPQDSALFHSTIYHASTHLVRAGRRWLH